jgi:enoyl-CoA hydratase/carnithine racemase
MTLPAAIRVVSSTAKIGFVFSQRGLVMEAASSFFLPRLIGHSRALHLTTTGSTYQATDPLLSNLFSEVLPNGEATLSRALQLASEVAANTSTVATSLMRDLMWRGPDNAEDTHLLDSAVIYGLFGQGDNEEGVKSFLEKRKPEFKASFQSTPEDLPQAYPWWKPVDTKVRSQARGTKAKL